LLIQAHRFPGGFRGVVEAASQPEHVCEVESNIGSLIERIRAIDQIEGLACQRLGLPRLSEARDDFGVDGAPRELRAQVVRRTVSLRNLGPIGGLREALLCVEGVREFRGPSRTAVRMG
jgi:hypothetical protein